MRHLPAPIFALSAILCAQEPFRARNYLPNDYRNVVHVDLARLRATGIWDDLEMSALKLIFGMIEQEAGVPLRALDRVTVVPRARDGEADGQGPRDMQVAILEGNTALDVPDRVLGNTAWRTERIGEHEVRRRDDWADEVFFQPRPEVQIEGSTALLRPVLENGPSPGMPCADILSLLSGRKGSLFYVVVDLADERLNASLVKTIFPDVAWPEGDAPQFMLVRVATAGDEDDPNVVVEAVLRHGVADAGIATSEQAAKELVAKGMATPQLRLVAPLLQKVESRRDRTDLTLTLDLGRGRTATGHLATMLLPLMAFGTTPVPAAAVPAVPVEEEEEPPPEKKKGEGKGKG